MRALRRGSDVGSGSIVPVPSCPDFGRFTPNTSRNAAVPRTTRCATSRRALGVVYSGQPSLRQPGLVQAVQVAVKVGCVVQKPPCLADRSTGSDGEERA